MHPLIEEMLSTIDLIGDLSADGLRGARERQEKLAKPTGALGSLEDISVQLAGITGKIKNSVKNQAIVIMCADNGVCEEGVASAPQSVTLSQTINFTRGLTGVSSMAKASGIDLLVVDCGVKLPIPEELYSSEMTEHICNDDACSKGLTKKIVNRRLADGTANLAKEPAMSPANAVKALMIGLEAVDNIKRAGYDIFGVGEMGIGNTTTSACVLSALTGKDASVVVGRGGGLNDAGLQKKIDIVREAASKQNPNEVLQILCEIGGFDLAAMTGAFLGAAYYKLPVVIDGYISAVAALCAARLAPKAKNFMFASHNSTEPGYKIAIEELGLKPMFDLGMRLGEGSGCPIAFKIIEQATFAMNGMATYDEGSIDADYLEERKEGNFF